MNANEVIECYVTEVALQLPRRQRNDVALELRALLLEGLQDRAEAAGRGADEAMALALVREFGRPDEVAARYRPGLAIIDPADGPAFLRLSLIGLALIWGLGLLEALQPANTAAIGWLQALGQWWGGTVVGSLWWPGVLVAWFGLSARRRLQPPQARPWQPRAADAIGGGRVSLVLGIAGIACGVFLLAEPRWILDVAFAGNAAPAAYDALTYTEGFRHRQAPVLFLLLLANIPLLLAVIATGRWTDALRRIETGLGLATGAVMAWTVLDGPAFITPAADGMFKFALVAMIVLTLAAHGVRLLRRVRPAPGHPVRG